MLQSELSGVWERPLPVDDVDSARLVSDSSESKNGSIRKVCFVSRIGSIRAGIQTGFGAIQTPISAGCYGCRIEAEGIWAKFFSMASR